MEIQRNSTVTQQKKCVESHIGESGALHWPLWRTCICHSQEELMLYCQQKEALHPTYIVLCSKIRCLINLKNPFI